METRPQTFVEAAANLRRAANSLGHTSKSLTAWAQAAAGAMTSISADVRKAARKELQRHHSGMFRA